MESGQIPTVDLTNKNLYLQCPWPNLLPHLQWTLGCKGILFPYTIITDQQIKNVYVGNEQYWHRPANHRDEVPIFNSVADLVGAEYHLVIIKLGYMGHPNRAAPGALKETLLVREDMNKPVWLVEDPRQPWSHSRDADVAYYVEQRFKKVPLEPADPGEGYDNYEESLGMEVEAYEPTIEPEEEARQEAPYQEESSGEDFDTGPLGGGAKKKRGRW